MTDKTPNYLISVNRWDILFGIKGNPQKCPVARALNRHFPFSYPSVESCSASFTGEKCALFFFPQEVKKFIREFDERPRHLSLWRGGIRFVMSLQELDDPATE